MSSPSHGAAAAPRGDGALRRILDVAFGFFVWAVHLLVIYISTAVACQLGLGAARGGRRLAFLTVLALVTVAAVGVVAWHGLRRTRQLRAAPEQHFRMSLTIGGDAIATVAVAWQLLALLLVPLCA